MLDTVLPLDSHLRVCLMISLADEGPHPAPGEVSGPASPSQEGASQSALSVLLDPKLLALSCPASSPPEGNSAQKHARLALLSLGGLVSPDPVNAAHTALPLGHKDPLLSALPDPGR